MIETKNLVRTFYTNEVATSVLKGINFKAETGEFVAVIGRSGAGKSTFLYQISLLDDPNEGEIIIDGKDTHNMSASEKSAFRLKEFGFVFQDYALLPELTALENVALPVLMANMKKAEAYQKATSALERVKLGHRLDNLPSQLSGGEQQRVSIARAVAHNPSILFADEPTANLDNDSAHTVLDIFSEIHASGQTIIMVTHEKEFARQAERIVAIDDGKVLSDESTGKTRKREDALLT